MRWVMRKLLLTIISLFYLVPSGWAATIYVVDGTANPGTKVCYKSGSWPAAACADGTDNSTIEAAYTAAGTGGSVIISGGALGGAGIVYTDTQLDVDNSIHDTANNVTVRGCKTTDTGYATHGGPVTIQSTTNHVFLYYDYPTATIENLKVVGPATKWAVYGANTLLLNDVNISASGMGLFFGGSGSIINRLKLDSAAGEYSVRLQGGSTINYSIFDGLGTPLALFTGNHTFNNCIFTGGKNSGAYSASLMITDSGYAGATVINNGLMTANAIDGYIDQYVIDNTSGGTITLNNPLFIQSPRGKTTSNVTINNPVYADPKFISTNRSGYATISVDDAANVGVFLSLGTYLPGAVTFFIEGDVSVISEENWTSIGSQIGAGNEVGGHTVSHCQLTATSPFIISSTQTNPTVEITTNLTDSNPANWTGTILLKEDGVSINGTGWSLTGASYDTIGELKTAIELNSGWSLTKNASCPVTAKTIPIRTATQSVSGAGYAFEFENNLGGSTPTERWWYHEIVYNKKLLETKLASVLGSSYTLKSFAYPGGVSNSSLKTFLATQSNYDPLSLTKYLAARSAGATGTSSWTLSSDYTSGTGGLAGLQIYEIYSPFLSTDIGTTNIDRVAIAWGQWMTYIAGYFVSYTHGVGEYSDANAKSFIDGLRQNPSLTLNTMGNIATIVRTSGLWTDADADGKRWTRAYTNSPNYRLRVSSPAINAGTDVGLTSDYAGSYVPMGGKVDIGAYEFFFGPVFGVSITGGVSR
jgi:hypothetical protein